MFGFGVTTEPGIDGHVGEEASYYVAPKLKDKLVRTFPVNTSIRDDIGFHNFDSDLHAVGFQEMVEEFQGLVPLGSFGGLWLVADVSIGGGGHGQIGAVAHGHFVRLLVVAETG
jgi:hypothetical protein